MTSLCMCISMSGTVALCCFFAPKVYIAVCQPYKNVRARQSAVGRLVNQQMKFMSQITTTAAPNDNNISTSVVNCSSYPHFASYSIVEAEKNFVTPSQITQKHGTVSSVAKKSLVKHDAKNNNNDITYRSNSSSSHENSPLLKSKSFLHQSPNNILQPDQELAKETILHQNNAELFLEQLFVNYDVTFL